MPRNLFLLALIAGLSLAYNNYDGQITSLKINDIDQFQWIRINKDKIEVNATLMDLIGRKFPPKEAFVVEATVQFTGLGNGEQTVAKMEFKTIVDIERSRVKSDSAHKLFAFGTREDLQTTVIDYDRLRMMVSNDAKKMCMKYNIKDSTPISINMDEIDVQLNTSLPMVYKINEIMNQRRDRFQYLGFQEIKIQRAQKIGQQIMKVHILKDIDSIPIYHPQYFLGVQIESGLETYYYLDDDFKLLGGVHFSFDTNSQFEVHRIDLLASWFLKTQDAKNKLELEFFQKECLDQYNPDEGYMLVDGEHVIKAVPISTMKTGLQRGQTNLKSDL